MSRWEWALPGSVRIAATIEGANECVLVGGTVASRAERGTKADGHHVDLPRLPDDDPADAPRHVKVTFGPAGKTCVLTLDGLEISPAVWPTAKKPVVEEAPPAPFPVRTIAIAAIGTAAVMGAFFLFRTRVVSQAAVEQDMTGIYRAPNGRFVAHFPRAFTSRAAVTPKAMSAVVLEDRGRGDAVIVLAAKTDEGNRTPWTTHKRLYGEAFANLARATPDHEEVKREEGTCLGEPGAILVERVTNAKRERAVVHSCAFVHAGAAYLLAWMIRESATADETARVTRVVEGTELTELYDMSEQP